jgi:signal transduction histidine kinase
VHEPRKTPDGWHELDLVYFIMNDREGEALGIIQVDYPLDGKVPTKETMESMEAFANMATIAVENSTVFKNMDRTKGEVRMYLDLLTHDIGNLVNPVNAYLEMVIAATPLTPVQHKYISSALEASRNMTHLIRNVRRSAQLLELDRAELVPVSLSRALRQSTADSRNAFLEKKVDIRLNLPTQDVWVVADNFLDEVLYNVFTNSIKYDEHDEIVIDVETKMVELENRDYAEIRVIDRGVGIPDDMKDKIFSREYRNLVKQDRPQHSKPKGAGMGLSIVKSLLDRYGGRIWVENRIRDDFTRGSVFIILLPKA